MKKLQQKIIKFLGWVSRGEKLQYPSRLQQPQRVPLQETPGFNDFMMNIDQQLHPQFYHN